MRKKIVIKLLINALAAFAIAGGFAVKYRNEAKVYRRTEIYGGHMAINALADATENVSREFSASVYAYSPQIIASLSNNIWKSRASAVDALSHMPIYDAQIENTRNFISRVEDYAYYLSRTAADAVFPLMTTPLLPKW